MPPTTSDAYTLGSGTSAALARASRRRVRKHIRGESSGCRKYPRSTCSMWLSSSRLHSQRSAVGSCSNRRTHPAHAEHTDAHAQRSAAEKSCAAPSSACGRNTLVGSVPSAVTCTSGSWLDGAKLPSAFSSARILSTCRCLWVACSIMTAIVVDGPWRCANDQSLSRTRRWSGVIIARSRNRVSARPARGLFVTQTVLSA
mmetsp:Transcript_8880/g.20739  ORF Transcript_8880/g.20739 Transcript_8880/m.20739 type:complete len:200 (-) Transcript_8880:84-683(-)